MHPVVFSQGFLWASGPSQWWRSPWPLDLSPLKLLLRVSSLPHLLAVVSLLLMPSIRLADVVRALSILLGCVALWGLLVSSLGGERPTAFSAQALRYLAVAGGRHVDRIRPPPISQLLLRFVHVQPNHRAGADSGVVFNSLSMGEVVHPFLEISQSPCWSGGPQPRSTCGLMFMQRGRGERSILLWQPPALSSGTEKLNIFLEVVQSAKDSSHGTWERPSAARFGRICAPAAPRSPVDIH